jgi:hypothetical protein
MVTNLDMDMLLQSCVNWGMMYRPAPFGTRWYFDAIRWINELITDYG